MTEARRVAVSALSLLVLFVAACSSPTGGESTWGDSGVSLSDESWVGDATPGESLLDTGPPGTPAARADEDGLLGVDVSGWNPVVDWPAVARAGISFAMVKASEADSYAPETFGGQFEGAAGAGLVRGAYHFGVPDAASGAAQADFFVAASGGWAADGQTLPGALDLEYNPYGPSCYRLSKAEMVDWVHDFSDEYERRTGRQPMIYTTADWWATCVGSEAFAETNPLWVAHYDASAPRLPAGWGDYAFWQHTNEGTVDGIPGDVDISSFPGDIEALVDLADDLL